VVQGGELAGRDSRVHSVVCPLLGGHCAGGSVALLAAAVALEAASLALVDAVEADSDASPALVDAVDAETAASAALFADAAAEA